MLDSRYGEEHPLSILHGITPLVYGKGCRDFELPTGRCQQDDFTHCQEEQVTNTFSSSI